MDDNPIVATILEAAERRVAYYTDRNTMMDRWLAHYWLLDKAQDQKQPGETRYKTTYPQAVVDRAVQILTRNPVHMHVVYGRELEDERELIGKIERFGIGLFRGINQQQRERLEMPAEQSIAWYALVRGWICGQIWLTKEKGMDNPFDFQMWDMRYVYPRRDRKGLHSVLYHQTVPMSEIVFEYPDAEKDVEEDDLDCMVDKYVWWDRKNYVVMADWVSKRAYGKKNSMVLYQLEHGLDKIPVVMIPVNGIPVKTVPDEIRHAYQDERNTGALWLPRGSELPNSQLAWTGMQGRSIFASADKAIGQHNHTMATYLHAMFLASYPTIKVFTRDGTEKEVSFGTAVVNYFSRQNNEDMEIIPSGGLPPGIERALAVVRNDITTSMVPDALLDQTAAMSGFDRAQIINVALNALGSFSDGCDAFQEEIVQHALLQLQRFPDQVTLAGMMPDRRKTFFEITFEPGEITRKYYIKVERTPALPDDMLLRAQLATQLTNPARPLMSIQTVLDTILKVDDVEGEQAKMFEDVAMSHPAAVAARVEKVLMDRGLTELVPYFTNERVIAEITQQMQSAALQGQMMQLGQGATGAPGVSPSSMPPEMGSPGSETGRNGDMMAMMGM